MKCHTGCSQDAVIAALRAKGLWPVPEQDHTGKLGPIIAEYVYCDESGTPLYRVTRHVPKTFRQWRADGCGGWLAGLGNTRRVLYRLPEVLEAPIVFVTEGEKDAETLREYGFVATTNAGGAKAAWLPEYTGTLCGREVILIPDNDPPGRERVLRIARALVGRVARLVVLELEGARDITEWFDRGHSELELIYKLDGEVIA